MSPITTDWRVRVRMYCQGLGDCFLLTFREKGAVLGHALIDSGVLNPDFSRLRQAVEDIARETGGKIDLLVGNWLSRLLVFRNKGTNARPVYAKPTWLDETVPSAKTWGVQG